MAARLAGDNVRRMYSRSIIWAPMRRGVTKRRWKDLVIPAMLRRDPVVAWVIDDTEIAKERYQVWRSGSTIRPPSGQTGELPPRGQPFGDLGKGEYAGDVPRS